VKKFQIDKEFAKKAKERKKTFSSEYFDNYLEKAIAKYYFRPMMVSQNQVVALNDGSCLTIKNRRSEKLNNI
jgi:hypothetical protein